MVSSEAKATSLYLLGRFLLAAPEFRDFVLEALRRIAKGFKDITSEDVKLQAISLAAQILSSPLDEGKLLARFGTSLADVEHVQLFLSCHHQTFQSVLFWFQVFIRPWSVRC